MRQVIHGEIYSSDLGKLDNVVVDWCSCYRFAFNRFQKDGLEFNEVRKRAKAKYSSLNTRQISDAVMHAQALFSRVGEKKIIFGGRKNWDRLKNRELSKEEWKNRRDDQIYSRGDRTKKGNPNIRLLHRNGDFLLRITVGNRRFEEYKLFIPAKFWQRLLFLDVQVFEAIKKV